MQQTLWKMQTLLPEGSLVKTYPVPEFKKDLPGKEALYTPKCYGLLAKYNQSSQSLRMLQTSFGEKEEDGFQDFSMIWPRSGLMLNGIVSRLPTLAPHITEIGSGFWPTPQASDNRLAKSSFHSLRNPEIIMGIGTEEGWINPVLSEWLMGYPDNWTDLNSAETV